VLLSPQLCLMAVCEDPRDAQRKLHMMKWVIMHTAIDALTI